MQSVAAWGPAAIAAIGSIGGSLIGSQGAKDAAAAAVAGTQAGIDESRRQFDIAQGNIQPAIDTGNAARDRLSAFLGIGNVSPGASFGQNNFGKPGAPIGPGGPSLTGREGRTFGGRTSSFFGDQGRFQRNPEGGFQGGVQGGQGVGEPLTQRDLQQQAFDNFLESPGQAFLRERGERALLRNASAIGGLGGGNVRRELQEQGIGVASTQLSELMDRLGLLSGSGAIGAGQLGQIGQFSANTIGGLSSVGGQLQAQGINARASGLSDAFRNILGAIPFPEREQSSSGGTAPNRSDVRLKENIQFIGSHQSHNIYTWDWNRVARGMGVTDPTIGVIAQEIPGEFVSERGGYLCVDYNSLFEVAI